MHFIFRISTEMFLVPFCQIQTFYCESTRAAQRLSSSASAPPSENIIAQVGNTQRPNLVIKIFTTEGHVMSIIRNIFFGGQNDFYVQVRSECLVIGGWQPAIWLDCNLNQGTSGSSNTFDNLPLSSPEFKVKDLECWAVSGAVEQEGREGRDRSEDQVGSSESLAFRRWRNMEDSRVSQVNRADGIFGSPCIETESFFLKKKQWEDSAGNPGVSGGSLVLEMLSLAETERTERDPALSDLTSSFTLGQDWTNSLHL